MEKPSTRTRADRALIARNKTAESNKVSSTSKKKRPHPGDAGSPVSGTGAEFSKIGSSKLPPSVVIIPFWMVSP